MIKPNEKERRIAGAAEFASEREVLLSGPENNGEACGSTHTGRGPARARALAKPVDYLDVPGPQWSAFQKSRTLSN